MNVKLNKSFPPKNRMLFLLTLGKTPLAMHRGGSPIKKGMFLFVQFS